MVCLTSSNFSRSSIQLLCISSQVTLLVYCLSIQRFLLNTIATIPSWFSRLISIAANDSFSGFSLYRVGTLIEDNTLLRDETKHDIEQIFSVCTCPIQAGCPEAAFSQPVSRPNPGSHSLVSNMTWSLPGATLPKEKVQYRLVKRRSSRSIALMALGSRPMLALIVLYQVADS